MQLIIYPGAANQPCQAEYGISITDDPSGARADIVVIDAGEAAAHMALVDASHGLDLVLNKILATDLQGIRIDLVRFFVIAGTDSPSGRKGYELPIRLDFEDYQRKGNPVEIQSVMPTSLKGWLRYVLGFYVKRVSASNRNVVGGCANVTTGLERARPVTAAEARLLLTAVGRPLGIPRALRLVSSR